MLNISKVNGTITLSDGNLVNFAISSDGTYQQWGNTQEALGSTVDAVTSMVDALANNDHLDR